MWRLCRRVNWYIKAVGIVAAAYRAHNVCGEEARVILMRE